MKNLLQTAKKTYCQQRAAKRESGQKATEFTLTCPMGEVEGQPDIW